MANSLKSFLAPQMEQYIEYRQSLVYSTTAIAWLRLLDRYLITENVTTLKVLTPLFFLKMRTDLAIDQNTINQVIDGLRGFFPDRLSVVAGPRPMLIIGNMTNVSVLKTIPITREPANEE